MTQAVSVHVKQLKQGCNEDFRYIEVVNLVAVNKPIQKAKKKKSVINVSNWLQTTSFCFYVS